MAETMEQLPLGTTEAAVRSCVSVIAAVTEQREDILAYWLDLYYQVRRAYELEQGHEEDPRLIRREDVYPVMRELLRDALKSSAREETEARAKVAAAEKEKKRRATPFKRQVAEELEQARAAGFTILQIAEASGGRVSENDVMSMLEKKILGPQVYVDLHDALNKLPAAAN